MERIDDSRQCMLHMPDEITSYPAAHHAVQELVVGTALAIGTAEDSMVGRYGERAAATSTV